MQAFNYDVSLDSALIADKYFKEFKKHLNDDYFEKLIEKYFINSNHYVIVTLNPSSTLEAENEKHFKEKMANIKASMTNDEIENLVKQTSDLIEYQSSVDTIENLRKLPTLDVSDIDLDVNKLNTKVLKEENVTNIIHEFNILLIAGFYFKFMYTFAKNIFCLIKYIFNLLISHIMSHIV